MLSKINLGAAANETATNETISSSMLNNNVPFQYLIICIPIKIKPKNNKTQCATALLRFIDIYFYFLSG